MECMKLNWKFQGEGGPNQITILGGGMDIFCNRTITVYGKAKFSASLSDSKSMESDHVEHVNEATCENYFHQDMHDKNTKLTSFGFFLRYCTMDCLNSPCEILIPLTKFSCSDNA